MIQVSDAFGGASATIGQHLDTAGRLLEAVRSAGSQAQILPFLSHLRAVAAEADAAMAAALASMEGTGSVGDGEFARLFSAGSAHGAMLGFCRSFETDPSEHVRMACAAGEAVLSGMDIRPEHARVIMAMRERISRMS